MFAKDAYAYPPASQPPGHSCCGRPITTGMLMLAVIILVGNKSDLTEQREVTTESGQEYAER